MEQQMKDFYGMESLADCETWHDLKPHAQLVDTAAAVNPPPSTLTKSQPEKDEAEGELQREPHHQRLQQVKFLLQQQYGRLNFEQFQAQMLQLQQELTVKERGLKSLVRQCFDEFVVAKGQVDVVYQRFDPQQYMVHSQRLSVDQLAKVELMALDAYQPLLDRRRKTDLVRYTMATLNRFQSLFSLPSQVFMVVSALQQQQQQQQFNQQQQQQLDQLVRDLRKGRMVYQSLKDKHLLAVFSRVWGEVQVAVGELQSALIVKLKYFEVVADAVVSADAGSDAAATSHEITAMLDEKERLIAIVNDLQQSLYLNSAQVLNQKSNTGSSSGGTQDVAIVLIESFYWHIAKSMANCYTSYVKRIEQLANGHLQSLLSSSKGDDGVSDSQQSRSQKFARELLLCKNMQQYKSMMKQEWHVQAWHWLSKMILDLNSILRLYFSNLARLCRNYIEGKYGGASLQAYRKDSCGNFMNQLIKLYESIIGESAGTMTNCELPMGFQLNSELYAHIYESKRDNLMVSPVAVTVHDFRDGSSQGSDLAGYSVVADPNEKHSVTATDLFYRYLRSQAVGVCLYLPRLVSNVTDAFQRFEKCMGSLISQNSSSRMQPSGGLIEVLKQQCCDLLCRVWLKDVSVLYMYNGDNGMKSTLIVDPAAASTSVTLYYTYQDLILKTLHQLLPTSAIDGLQSRILTAFEESSLSYLDGMHLLAVHPSSSSSGDTALSKTMLLKALSADVVSLQNVVQPQLQQLVQELFDTHTGDSFNDAALHLQSIITAVMERDIQVDSVEKMIANGVIIVNKGA